MAHTIIKVAYEPAFTTEFKHWIKANISASMVSADDTTKQYSLDFITTELEDREDKEERQLFVEDAPLLAQLNFEKVEYVEI